MKKNSDGSSIKRAKHAKRRSCLMAYTLNNEQPVICTLVADQPYFYMEEEQLLEDDILGFDEYADFEADLADIKKKMESLNRLTKMFESNPERRIQEFGAEAINIGEPVSKNDHQAQNAIDKTTKILSQSRMAQYLLSYAQEHKVDLVDSMQEQSARYDGEANVILINSFLSESEMVLLTVRELRRHWQHKQGVMIHPLSFHPDHAILINRAQQADLTISMIRAGWELQLAGHRACWEYIDHSHFGDLGRAYATEAFADFRSINSGKASLVVFERWFLSERCRHQDKKLIQEMLADHQGYVFKDTDSSRMVSIDLVSALGMQPFGKNYLASSSRSIVEDPIFSEVRDRSNANFLWFVKFERSFQETEHALQSDEGKTGANPFNTPHPFLSGRAEQNDSKSTVLQFRPNEQSASLAPHDRTGANIIHVRFGEGKSA